MLVKICGTTSVHDALLARDSGADFLGIILEHPPSPRNISGDMASAIREAVEIPIVVVTVNQQLSQLLQLHEEVQPDALQLHGDESPELVRDLVNHGIKVWCAVGGDKARERADALLAAGAEAILVDSRSATKAGETIYGGTGKRSDWKLARDLSDSGANVVLSGGLSPNNVAQAIEEVNPWLVDTVSGVESKPGTKDGDKVRDFVHHARFQALNHS